MIISALLFSCVEKDKCNQNKVNRRSGGILGLEIAVADDAICPKISEVCCANQEIVRECSDFSADGFKCVNACFDMPQDFIPEGAKDAKCDQKGQTCCKRTKPPTEVPMPDNIKRCEDAEPNHKCLDFDMCDPDSDFFSKKDNNVVRDYSILLHVRHIQSCTFAHIRLLNKHSIKWGALRE